MSLNRALAARAAADPARIALHAEGRSLTRGQLHGAIAAAVRCLRDDWGIVAGDRVGYLGVNRSEELILLFALAHLGAVFAPLNIRLAVNELVAVAAHAQLRALVVDAIHREIGAAVVEAVAPGSKSIRLHDVAALEGPDDAFDGEDADPGRALLLAYTSGTTGVPRGALHTQRAMLANIDAAIAAHAMTERDCVLTALPLFHVGGLCIQTLPALLAGAPVVLMPRFEAAAWLAAIAEHRPTLALMVPATLRAVIADPAWPTCGITCLRLLMAGSSTIPRALIDAVHARGVPLGQIYGATETGPVTIALGADDARRKAGRAGWPCFPDSIRLVDPAGDQVADGGVGEILVRAPNLMQGYWRELDGTGFRAGWFATGDLARRDDEGCYEIVGRSRDLIISGGENIHPSEVEDALLAVDGVAEVAVVGMPDERWGEVPVAFVVRRIDQGATTIDAASLSEALGPRLARFKHPKRIVFVDRLPRNAMGKVQAQLLRAALDAAEGSISRM